MASTPSPIEAPPPSYEIAQLNLDQKLAVAAERSLNISQQRRERERDDCPEERDEASEEAHQVDASRNSEQRAASGQIDGQRSAVRPLKFRKKSRGSKDDSSLSTKDKERPSWFEEAHLRPSASNSSASGRPLPAPRGAREHNSRTSSHVLPEDSDEDRLIPPPPFAEIDNSLDGPVYERYASSDARRRRTGGTVVLRYMGEDYTTASPPSSSHSLSGAQLRHNTAPSQENSRLHHAPQHSRLDVPTVMPRPRSADPQVLPPGPAPPRLSFDPYVAYEGTRSSVYGQILADSRDASCDATSLYSSAVAPHLSSQKSRPVAPKVKRYTPSISSLPEYEQHQHHQAVPSSAKPVQDYATSRASVYSQSSVSHIPQYPQIAQYPQMAQYQTQQNYTRPMSATQSVDSQRWSTASSHHQSRYYP